MEKSINLNHTLLREELGLVDKDIIAFPQRFCLALLTNTPSSQQTTKLRKAMLPQHAADDRVGQGHWNSPSPLVPKSRAPAAWKKRAYRLLEPLGLKCTFIDDLDCYLSNMEDACAVCIQVVER